MHLDEHLYLACMCSPTIAIAIAIAIVIANARSRSLHPHTHLDQLAIAPSHPCNHQLSTLQLASAVFPSAHLDFVDVCMCINMSHVPACAGARTSKDMIHGVSNARSAGENPSWTPARWIVECQICRRDPFLDISRDDCEHLLWKHAGMEHLP